MAARIDSDLVEVLRAFHPVELSIAQDCLREAGIESFIFDQHAGGLVGMRSAVPARLMVFAADAARASQILNDFGSAS